LPGCCGWRSAFKGHLLLENRVGQVNPH
jgi:hypothetical protein